MSGGSIINYGKICEVADCKNVRLRHPLYCQTHAYRLKKWGNVREDLPVKYLYRPKGVVRGPTYNSWRMMKNRCTNPNAMDWKYYGGRGITMCDRWRSFDNFLADMGERPDIFLTLDRIDNEKGYSPKNCRWATKQEQRLNQRKRNYEAPYL